MAKLFGRIKGYTAGRPVSAKGGKAEARRLAEDQIDAEVSANRRTTATIQLFADGSGTFTLVRDGVTIAEHWNADDKPLSTVYTENDPQGYYERAEWGKRVEASDARD